MQVNLTAGYTLPPDLQALSTFTCLNPLPSAFHHSTGPPCSTGLPYPCPLPSPIFYMPTVVYMPIWSSPLNLHFYLMQIGSIRSNGAKIPPYGLLHTTELNLENSWKLAQCIPNFSQCILECIGEMYPQKSHCIHGFQLINSSHFLHGFSTSGIHGHAYIKNSLCINRRTNSLI